MLERSVDGPILIYSAKSLRLQKEKEIASSGLNPVGKAKIAQRLFSLTPYIDIAEDVQGRRIAVCSQCNHVYCEADNNFKLYCLVYDRDPTYFHLGKLAYDREWCIFREFYCPTCAVQIEVEAVPPGSPFLWNYEFKD